MLIIKLKPSKGLGARKVEDPRGPGDCVRLFVPPGKQERVIVVTLAELCGLAANLGIEADRDIRIEREGI